MAATIIYIRRVHVLSMLRFAWSHSLWAFLFSPHGLRPSHIMISRLHRIQNFTSKFRMAVGHPTYKNPPTSPLTPYQRFYPWASPQAPIPVFVRDWGRRDITTVYQSINHVSGLFFHDSQVKKIPIALCQARHMIALKAISKVFKCYYRQSPLRLPDAARTRITY